MNAPEDPDRMQPPVDGRPRRRVAVLGIVSTLASVGTGLLFIWVTATRGVEASAALSSILGLIAAVVALIITLPVLPIHRRRASSSGGKPTFAARIDDATRSLEIAARLVDELHTEMQARMVTLERLHVENAEYEKLAAVQKEEAEAVSRLIENVISGTHTRLSRSSRRDQVLFFVAGLAASIPVQIVVNLVIG